MKHRPSAVLWDCDGTLIDSEPMWLVVEQELATELGGVLPDDHHEANVGASADTTAEYIRVHTGTQLTQAEVLTRLLEASEEGIRANVAWIPGGRALVDAFAAAGVPQALVSSSRRAYLEAVLERWPDHPFAVVVGADDVEHTKPDPEPYLVAAQQLGVDVREAWVFEDSATGVRAGLASGARVFVIPEDGTTPPPAAERLCVLTSLAGLTPDDLSARVSA